MQNNINELKKENIQCQQLISLHLLSEAYITVQINTHAHTHTHTQTHITCNTVYKNFYLILLHKWASLVSQMVKNLSAMQETWVQSLGWEDPLEEGMATHSSILVVEAPWTEEPGRLTVHGVAESDKTE